MHKVDETALTAVAVVYTNWRGETAEREIRPKRMWFGSTEWHPEPQWLITAVDVQKGVERDFALSGFGRAALPPEAVLSVPSVVEVKPLAWLRRVSTKWGDGPDEYTGDVALADMWRSHPNTFDVTPLYAAPSPQPATDAVEARRPAPVDFFHLLRAHFEKYPTEASEHLGGLARKLHELSVSPRPLSQSKPTGGA